MTLVRVMNCYRSGEEDQRKIQVAVSADDMGETMSFGYGQHLISLDFKPIEQMMEKERAESKKGYHVRDDTKNYISAEWLREYIYRIKEETTMDVLIDKIISDWGNECYDALREELSHE